MPTISHSYADGLTSDEQYAVFQAKVTIMRSGFPTLVTPKTVTVTNVYALSKLRGTLRPPVRDVTTLSESGGALVGQFSVKNLETTAITFTERRFRHRYCEADRDPKLLDPEPVSITIGAQAQVVQSLSLTGVPADVCGVAVNLSGKSPGGLAMRASAYLDIPARAPHKIIQNPQLVAALNQLRAQGLLPNPDRVTDEDLLRLVRQRRLTPLDIVEPAPGGGVASAAATSAAAGVGDECHPGDTPPGPNLSCVPSGEWSEEQALIENGEKGDILLVAECSFVGSLLRHVSPRQRYSHEGIMTRNFVRLSQSTSSEERVQDIEENHIGILGSDGIKTDVLKFGWPGVLHQSISEAFLGQTLIDPDGRELPIDAYSPNPIKCPDDQDITVPIVVRPPLDALPEVRAKLHAAADVAQGLTGHYRFFAFSDGKIAFDPFFDHEGRPATVSSQFIWFALKKAGLTLEGPNVEDRDRDGITGLHLGGAVIDSKTEDGLYVYTEQERKDAAQWLYDFVYGQILGVAGTFGQFALDAPLAWANQTTNCLAWDFCGHGDVETLCSLPEDERPVVDSGPVLPDINECCRFPNPTLCAAQVMELWRDPGVGRAVSPDNFLFWDKPAGTEGAQQEPSEDGVYGDFERMIYRDNGRVPVFRWTPTQGFGAVQGVVLTQGDQACVTDTECPAGDVCNEKSCKHACSQDANCVAGSTCHLASGFCARPVENATVFFEEAAPDDTTHVTDSDGMFAPYQNIAVSGQTSVINARLVTDPDPTKFGDESVLLGKTEFVLEDQKITDVTIFLRPTDPSLRLVTLEGLAHMLDCDCDSANETGTREFFVTCSVGAVDTFEVTQTDMCVDEIGIRILGRCDRLSDQRTVRVSGSVELYEGEENSCGGTELEDFFIFSADIPPAELHPPGTRFSLNMENGLKHEDLCQFLLYPVDCDDEAWGTGASTAVNEIQF